MKFRISINGVLILIFSLTLAVKANILLQKPKTLSELEINELAKKWSTQFSWCYRSLTDFTWSYENEQASFLVRCFKIPIYSYNYKYLSHFVNFISELRHFRNYHFAKPLKFDDALPQNIALSQLITLLENKKFIFYTGAGISAASNVATLNELTAALKLDKGNKQFIKELWLNPQGITKTFANFCKSAIYNKPTTAHYALKEIAESKSVAVITENVDLLQQRTGIEPIFAYSDKLNCLQKNDFTEIDFIICVGMSHDDRGFLAWYKKNNPEGKIIAIDFKIPNYLSRSDFLLQGDLQQILPDLTVQIKN